MDQVYLKKIQIENFRNLDNKIIDFSEGINCIFGNNGNGKTNLLEAIYYLINRKSFRKNTSFPQMISVESEKPEIIFSSVFQASKEIETLSGKIENKVSQWFYNNQPTKRKIDLKTIFINPFDSFSFHTTPQFRRNWVDTHLSYISDEYKKTLNKFVQSLRFRNNLLSKKPKNFIEQIHAINPQISELSFKLIEMRKNFLNELKEYCMLTFKLIFDETHNLEIEYHSRFDHLSQQEIQDYYENSIEKDTVIGYTRSGVHKCDYVFQFDGYNSYEYCSLGQQKMSYLSLLFAYIELFRYKFNSYPMVLIDDVSGELDERRWKNLINYLQAKKFQVLITTANDNFKKELEKIEEAKKIFIDNGLIK
ncbi:MAG: DNA replication and repair protein RecF [Bacteriovoracaceae bacterium]|jgi:DNA replication and repair protein RecF|nr:DNA replication and repair protein RecF [Bacteriovoracaceae bacterium]